jgi:hypothetical protein
MNGDGWPKRQFWLHRAANLRRGEKEAPSFAEAREACPADGWLEG